MVGCCWMFLICLLTSWYLATARKTNSVLLIQDKKCLGGKLRNSVSLLRNSKQLIGNAFYSSCLWTPWEMTEFLCWGSHGAWEHFWSFSVVRVDGKQYLLLKLFQAKMIFAVLYVMEPWGLSRAFLMYQDWPQAARGEQFWLVLVHNVCNPPPYGEVVGGASRFPNRSLAVPFPPLISPIENKLWGPLKEENFKLSAIQFKTCQQFSMAL